MNEKVPSYFQLMTSFDTRCTHQCKTCRFGGVNCRAEFFYNILTGCMTLNDSFKKPNKEEPEHDPKFPAWFKPGAWVMSHEGYPLSKKPMMIEDIQPDGKATLGCNGWSVWRAPEEVDPVKFRPYTFDEAKKLLGKVIEFTDPDTKSRHLHTITQVYEYEGVGGLEPGFNNFSQEGLMALNATINGIPVGVPEIDEEALQKGE